MITTPFSLELTKDEDAKDAEAGAVATVVAGKVKIFLGANVLANRPQVYVGTLRACYRHLMNERAKRGVAGDLVSFGDWQNASAGNITIASDIAGLDDDDVAIVLSDTFNANTVMTHFVTETFNQLMNVLLERTKDN